MSILCLPTHRWLLLAPVMLAASVPMVASAFIFSDGTSATCIANGAPVPEFMAGPDDPFSKLGRIGLAEKSGAGYRITWNAARLKALPPLLHDFVYFHECAHATVPTEVELEANCAGLKAMRAAGRAGPAVESRLKAMFPNNPYWNDTFACADRPAP